MSEFFDSEMVREVMNELEEMQCKLFTQIFDIPYASNEEKKEYLQLMRNFLEKQKLLLFRMSLSDDPEAQATKTKVLESAKLFGLKEEQSMDEFFELLESPIKKLEKTLDP